MNEIEKAIEGFKIDNVLLFGSNSDEVIERNKLAIQALQEKAERDKMRCENCKYFFCESAVDRYFHCNNFHGLKNIDAVENKTFCSYFEIKEVKS